MTEPSEAAMNVWREAFDEAIQGDQFSDTAAALVIDRAMVAGEPVAWMYEWDTLGRTGLFQERLPEQYRRAYQIETPLYTHPAPDTAALVGALERVLSWWPEGSETASIAGKAKGTAFAADIQTARALIAQHKGTEHG